MSNQPLNIVLPMSDQGRWDTIFHPDHPCRTPNLQFLAQQGVAFDRAFSCVPLCCPARYKYTWSPNDLCELYDLETDPGERVNLIDDPAHTAVQADLHQRLVAWMEAKNDALLHARHLPPVGSYVGGRSFDEQHDPGWSERDKAWFAQR